MGKVIKKASDFGKVSVKAASFDERWEPTCCLALTLRCLWGLYAKSGGAFVGFVGFSSAVVLNCITSLDLFCMGR